MEKPQDPEPTLDRKEIGRRIALRRMEMGLSQSGLAAYLGIKQSSVSVAESEGLATVAALGRWASALRCDRQWLAYGPDNAQQSVKPLPSLSVIREELDELQFRVDAIGWRVTDAQARIDALRERVGRPEPRPLAKARERSVSR